MNIECNIFKHKRHTATMHVDMAVIDGLIQIPVTEHRHLLIKRGACFIIRPAYIAPTDEPAKIVAMNDSAKQMLDSEIKRAERSFKPISATFIGPAQ